MRWIFATLLVLAVSLVPGVTLAASTNSLSCKQVSGHFTGSAAPQPYGFDSHVVELTGGLSGPAVGSKLTEVTVKKMTPGGTIFFSETGDFATTAFGELFTQGGGVIAANGHVVDVLVVGDGGYGIIVATGTADLVQQTIDVDYNGRICTQ